MPTSAILTCDIVNSTKITAAKEKKILLAIKELFINEKIEFFRGDSFQALVKEPSHALMYALLCRLAVIRFSKVQTPAWVDVRISIGIGEVKYPARALATGKGYAFILSGRTFDSLAKTNQRLAITIAKPLANEALQIVADFANHLFEKITGKQAEVLFELLQGATQIAIAQKTKKTKSTIHQLATSANWIALNKLMLQYNNIIKLAAL